MQRFTLIGLLLLSAIATGFWLGFSGRPLNPLLSTGHKLLALAWVILTAVVLYHSAGLIGSRFDLLAAAIVLHVSILTLFASGALLLMPNAASAAWLLLHRFGSAFAVGSAVLLARLLLLKCP